METTEIKSFACKKVETIDANGSTQTVSWGLRSTIPQIRAMMQSLFSNDYMHTAVSYEEKRFANGGISFTLKDRANKITYQMKTD